MTDQPSARLMLIAEKNFRFVCFIQSARRTTSESKLNLEYFAQWKWK
jgi:hypothetical protein